METKRNRIFYVATRMDWYWNLISILKENAVDDGASSDLRGELEKRITDLYKALLSYQMKSVCSYYRNQGLRFLHSLILPDDWDGRLQEHL